MGSVAFQSRLHGRHTLASCTASPCITPHAHFWSLHTATSLWLDRTRCYSGASYIPAAATSYSGPSQQLSHKPWRQPRGAGRWWPLQTSITPAKFPNLTEPAIRCASTGVLGANREDDAGGVIFFATCHPGLELVVAQELGELGYLGVEPSKAGVSFRGRRLSDGYAANLWLRSAIRVLVLLAEGSLGGDPRVGVRGGQALYDLVYGAAPWYEIIPPQHTFSVEPRLWSCTDLSSTRLVWSRVKDAVCDSIRNHRKDKPPPPLPGEIADVPLHVSCYHNHVRIFRDMSGRSLHRRGYRDVMHRAALNEAAAAGVLVLSGWRQAVLEAGDGEGLVLADPMCGSGTFLIEAALIARDIAPGFMRSLGLDETTPAPDGSVAGGNDRRRNAALAAGVWPFQRWGDYDAAAWALTVEAARARVRPPWKGKLLGVDIHEGALSLAVRQAKKAGVYDMLDLRQGDCGEVTPWVTPNFVVTNPPWGMRMDGSGAEMDGDGDVDMYDTGDIESSPPDGHGGGRLVPGSGPGSYSSASEAFLSDAWRSLDGFLYRQCPGASATVVSGNPSAFRYLKLRPQSKHRLVLSGVNVQVATYTIRDAASRSKPQPTGVSAADDLVTDARMATSGPTNSAPERPVAEADTLSSIAATERSAETVADYHVPAHTMPPTGQKLFASSALAAGAAASRRQAKLLAATTTPTGSSPISPSEYLEADDDYWMSG